MTTSDTVIKNNTRWMCRRKETVPPDQEGKEGIDESPKYVLASMGGHISKFGNYYYWVGTDPRARNSSNRIYRSKTMGSGTWELVQRVEKRVSTDTDMPRVLPANPNALPEKVQGRRNCTLLHCNNEPHDYYVIYAKGVGIYKSKDNHDIDTFPYNDDNWEWLEDKVLDECKLLEKVDELPQECRPDMSKFKPCHFHAGGMSAYCEVQDPEDPAKRKVNAYLVISMKKHSKFDDDNNTVEDPKKNRWVLIVKMTEDFLAIDRVVAFEDLNVDKREAFWLFKKDKKYYLSYDGPGGWQGSDCYYRIADAISGPWSPTGDAEEDEHSIDFIPEIPDDEENERSTRKDLRSYASQHRYIMQVGNQWIYGGDRYPHHEPESHKLSHGYHIMLPVHWEGDRPIVTCVEEWDIANYNNEIPPDQEVWHFRDSEITVLSNITNARKAVRDEVRPSVGICVNDGVVIATLKQKQDESELYEIGTRTCEVYAGVCDHYKNDLVEQVTDELAVTERVREMASTMKDRIESDEDPQIHLSLLVAGSDTNSTNSISNNFCLYHIDPSGRDPIERDNHTKWTAAAIGNNSKKATESLEKKYATDDSTDDVGNLDTAIPVALLALKDTLDSNSWTEIETKAEIIYVNGSGIYCEDGDDLKNYIDLAKEEEASRDNMDPCTCVY